MRPRGTRHRRSRGQACGRSGRSPGPFQLALRKVVERDYERAVELLLELMQKDRGFGDDAGRRGLLKTFELLGVDPLVSCYPSRMARLLF